MTICKTCQAFKTPEIIKLFAAKQPGNLRQKLVEIDRQGLGLLGLRLICLTYFRDFKVGKLDKDLFAQQKMEIIGALAKLGEELSENEKIFFDNNSDSSMKKFAQVKENIVIKDGLLKQDQV